MDNITHSLFGLAAAELALEMRLTRRLEVRPLFRFTAWATSIVANNFPDVDFLYAGLTEGKLGYLLHHRGHTHTLAAVPLEGLLLFGLTWLFAKLRKISWTPGEWRTIASLIAVGPLIHLFLDGMNSYGVHPFWPVENGWHYGDTLFIIEPWLWITLAVGMWRVARWPLLFVALLTNLLCWFTGYVSWPLALLLTAWSLGLGYWARRSRAWLSARVLILSLGVIGLFHATSIHVRRAYTWYAEQRHPGRVLRDVILSPLPANPFCWTVITVDTGPGDRFRLQRGMIAAFPGVFPVASCPRPRRNEPTLPMKPLASGDARRFLWHGEWETSLSEAASLARTHCGFSAFLRYARAPFYLPVKEDGEFIAGDLRFDWDKSLGFAEMLLPGAMPSCPRLVPPWHPPRAELF